MNLRAAADRGHCMRSIIVRVHHRSPWYVGYEDKRLARNRLPAYKKKKK